MEVRLGRGGLEVGAAAEVEVQLGRGGLTMGATAEVELQLGRGGSMEVERWKWRELQQRWKKPHYQTCWLCPNHLPQTEFFSLYPGPHPHPHIPGVIVLCHGLGHRTQMQGRFRFKRCLLNKQSEHSKAG